MSFSTIINKFNSRKFISSYTLVEKDPNYRATFTEEDEIMFLESRYHFQDTIPVPRHLTNCQSLIIRPSELESKLAKNCKKRIYQVLMAEKYWNQEIEANDLELNKQYCIVVHYNGKQTIHLREDLQSKTVLKKEDFLLPDTKHSINDFLSYPALLKTAFLANSESELYKDNFTSPKEKIRDSFFRIYASNVITGDYSLSSSNSVELSHFENSIFYDYAFNSTQSNFSKNQIQHHNENEDEEIVTMSAEIYSIGFRN